MSAKRTTRPGGERGAVAVFAVITALVILTSAAFAVDLGMQRVARSDLQALADVVALDLARDLDGSHSPQYFDTAWATAGSTMAQSLQRNPVGVGQSSGANSPWLCSSRACIMAEAGHMVSGSFVAYSSTDSSTSDTPTAVRVSAQAKVPFGFSNVIGISSGSASRTSVAVQTPRSQCYSVGSFALSTDTNNSILGPLLSKLGISAAATALSSAGIANTNISLGAIATQLGVGTPQGLISQGNVTIGQFVAAAITVMTQNGNTASVTALQSIQASLGVVANNQLNLGQLVNLGTGGGSAADAEVNLGTLLAGSLELANGSNALTIPGLAINPGFGTISAQATIIKPPVQGCNGGSATSSQVSIELKAQPNQSLGGALLGGYATQIDVIITLANATAASDTTVPCSTSSIPMKVTNQTLANIRIKFHVSNLLGLVQGDIDTGAPGAGPTGSYTLNIPPNDTTPLQTGSGTLGINLTNAQAQVTLLGLVSINVSNLLSGLTSQLNGLLSGALTTVLGTLGTVYAGANLLAITPVTCSGPQLAG